MTIEIDWFAFLLVFTAALVGAVLVVGFYALGLRLLAASGRVPVVAPAEFTDAITVLSEKGMRRAEKAAAKAAKKNPLTRGQKAVARFTAWVCFAMCAVAIVVGILLIVFFH